MLKTLINFQKMVKKRWLTVKETNERFGKLRVALERKETLWNAQIRFGRLYLKRFKTVYGRFWDGQGRLDKTF